MELESSMYYLPANKQTRKKKMQSQDLTQTKNAELLLAIEKLEAQVSTLHQQLTVLSTEGISILETNSNQKQETTEPEARLTNL